MTILLFPSDPSSIHEIDPDFESERSAAREAGLSTALIDHTRVVAGDAIGAVARVPEGAGLAMYRGWMPKPGQYGRHVRRAPDARRVLAQHAIGVPDVSLPSGELRVDRRPNTAVPVVPGTGQRRLRWPVSRGGVVRRQARGGEGLRQVAEALLERSLFHSRRQRRFSS